MRTIMKLAAVAALASAITIPMTSPTYARDGRNASAAIGFGAGALAGAAAATTAYGYGPSYYDYGPGYDTYAYEPDYAAPVYAYVPAHRHHWSRSNIREHQCMLPPGSQGYIPCDNNF